MSSTLVGECECMVSQGETLMQERRDQERNAGTIKIREEPTMDALDSTQFTHDNPVYPVLAEQFNIQA